VRPLVGEVERGQSQIYIQLYITMNIILILLEAEDAVVRRPSSHHSIHRIQKTYCSGTQVLLRLNTASTQYTGLSAVNGQPQFPPFTNCSAGTRKDPLELGPQVSERMHARTKSADGSKSVLLPSVPVQYLVLENNTITSLKSEHPCTVHSTIDNSLSVLTTREIEYE
jgi:hypothetical protein